MLLSLIPSFGRVKWLVNEWMPAYSTRVLEPMRGKVEALVLVQNPSYAEIMALELSACRYQYLTVDYVWHQKGTPIGKIRSTALVRGMELYSDLEYIWMQDDDTYPIPSARRIQDHLGAILGSLDQSEVKVLYPGVEYKEQPISMDLTKFETVPSFIRGQIYPTARLNGIDWSRFNDITNGEDYVLPRLLNLPIKAVHCLDEILHLCSNSWKTHDMGSRHFASNKEVDHEFCERSFDFLTAKYNFKGTGFLDSDAKVEKYSEYFKLYPEYFEKDGTYKALDITQNN